MAFPKAYKLRNTVQIETCFDAEEGGPNLCVFYILGFSSNTLRSIVPASLKYEAIY